MGKKDYTCTSILVLEGGVKESLDSIKSVGLQSQCQYFLGKGKKPYGLTSQLVVSYNYDKVGS